MDIQTQLEDLSPVKKRLVVEVPADDASKELERITIGYSKQARLPGFRRGRAPRGLVKRHFAANIREDLMNKLVPEAYDQAVKEHELKPLGQPQLEDLNYEAGEPLKFVAEFEVRPEFTVPEYKNLKVSVDVTPVTDGDIEKELNRLQEQHSVLESVEDRSIENGDYAIIDLAGEYISADNEEATAPPFNDEDVVIEVGSEQTHEAFNTALIGMNIGEEKELEVEYAADHNDSNLAGKTVRFKILVSDIKLKRLPELDDDFAKDLGSDETLESVKSKIREDLEKKAQRERDREFRHKLIEQLVGATDFEAPELLIEERIDEKVHSFANSLMRQGVDPTKADIDWPKFREDVRQAAASEARANLILDKIAELEDIEVTKEELDSEVTDIATSLNQPVESVRQKLVENGRLIDMAASMMRKKVINMLAELNG